MSEGRAQPFCSVQAQIQSGILFLTRQLQNLSSHERKQCLEEVWDWARQRADLLSLQVIRGYRECCRRSGPTYLRHRAWYWGNRDNPEFWAEWERRFSVPATDGTAESICAKIGAALAQELGHGKGGDELVQPIRRL